MRIGLYALLKQEWQFVSHYPVYLYASAIVLLIGPRLYSVWKASKKLAIGSIVSVAAFGTLTLFTDQPGYYLLFFIALAVIVCLIRRRNTRHRKRPWIPTDFTCFFE
jgi:membrane protein implicated in regulation of membrane protease activity